MHNPLIFFFIVIFYGHCFQSPFHKYGMESGMIVTQHHILGDTNIVLVTPEDYPKLYKQWYFIPWVMDTMENFSYQVEIFNAIDDEVKISSNYTLNNYGDFDFWWGVSDMEKIYQQHVSKNNQYINQDNLATYTTNNINEKIILIFPKIKCGLLLKIIDEDGRVVNNPQSMVYLKRKIQKVIDGKYKKIFHITGGIIGAIMGVLLAKYIKKFPSLSRAIRNIYGATIGGLMGTLLAYKIF